MIYENILQAIGRTPLIRLQKMTGPQDAQVLVKYEAVNIGGSIKTRTAYNMITKAREKGLIGPDTILVEPTSGNQGIGVALVGALPALDKVEAADKDEEVGVAIIRKALEAPMRAIAQNAGFEGSVVVERVKGMATGEGLNCANGEYGNMIEMGVNDPVKVTRTALQSAASVAALILITEATINDIPKDPDPAALAAMAGAGGGMGGMM